MKAPEKIADITITMDDISTVMKPNTDAGRKELKEPVMYWADSAPFLVPGNMAHFRANGLEVEFIDKRKKKNERHPTDTQVDGDGLSPRLECERDNKGT